MKGMNLWDNSFTDTNATQGFLLVATDGRDTTGEVSQAGVIAARDFDNKSVFTVSLPGDIASSPSLSDLAST